MMSRSSGAPQRTLSLTEELEKLEQSITLTLQEIDHNFSRAHRIVTTSILPIVEQYGEHSRAVWEGSKFWKQFFEASANVSLSGYEELASQTGENEEEDATTTSYDETSTPRHSQYGSPSQPGSIPRGNASTVEQTHLQPESILSSPSVTNSTPRAAQKPKSKSSVKAKAKPGKGQPPEKFAEYPSPYEAMKRELKGKSRAQEEDASEDPSTPAGARGKLPDMSMATPGSSPFLQAPNTKTQATKGGDLLLHRVLDKNYRLQATPHSTRGGPYASIRKPATTANKTTATPAQQAKARWQDSSPFSSPLAAPNLNAEIFSSPYRSAAPRTPGISVFAQTPRTEKSLPRNRNAARSQTMNTDFEGKTSTISGKTQGEAAWSDSEDEDEDEGEDGWIMGMSPPKTMTFHIPQTRLLQTPAREASKKIVSDLLQTAGVDNEETDDFDIDIDLGAEYDQDHRRIADDDDSPSVVRVTRPGEMDESF